MGFVSSGKESGETTPLVTNWLRSSFAVLTLRRSITGRVLSLSRRILSHEGTLEFGGFDSKDIYVRHQGKLRIVAAGKSIVRVTTYDDVEIDAEAIDDARIFIYHHGGKVRMSGRVAYREREQAQG